MSTIKRYCVDMRVTEDGMVPYLKADERGAVVLYDDHVAALEEQKKELVEWLDKQYDDYGQPAYLHVADHLNTKKAVSQVGVVATADIPLENFGPVIEAGDLLVQDGATQRTKLVATNLFGDRPEASGRERLTWYVDYRAGETEYRVVEQLPER